MESYEEYSSQAKLYTSIHAKPNSKQQELMKSFMAGQTQNKKSEPMQEQRTKVLDSQPQQTISLFSNENNNASQQQNAQPGVLGFSSLNNSAFPQPSCFGFNQNENKGAFSTAFSSNNFGGENQNQNIQFENNNMFESDNS